MAFIVGRIPCEFMHRHDFSYSFRQNNIVASTVGQSKWIYRTTDRNDPRQTKFRRRDFPASGILLALIWRSSILPSFGSEYKSLNSSINMSSMGTVADLIKSECGTMLRYSQATGKFLYRGGNNQGNSIDASDPDLLVSGTYTEEGTAFFRRLETWLEVAGSLARPSTGHIAISNKTEAGLWGTAHSCWPIGKFRYVWFGKSRLLFPTTQPFDALEIQLDSNLGEALRRGHEVLFTAPAFILVPAAADAQLRDLLDVPPPR